MDVAVADACVLAQQQSKLQQRRPWELTRNSTPEMPRGTETTRGLKGGQKRARTSQVSAGSTDLPPEPTTPPGLAPKQLSLQDILDGMANGFASVGKKMDNVQGQVNKVQEALTKRLSRVERKQKESQHIAAKALTATEAINKKVTGLEARLTAIEKGHPTPSAKHGTSGGGGMGYDKLGGDEGSEVVMGQFPDWSSKADRDTLWESLKTKLPQDLQNQVEEVTAPGLKGKVVIVSLIKEATVKETRQRMLRFCKTIKEAKLTYQADGQELQIYAIPSKPFEQRQKETAAGIKFDTLRRLLPQEVSEGLEFEVGKGRVFHGRKLLAARSPNTQEVQYHLTALQTIAPMITTKLLDEEEKKVRQERNEKRTPA